MVIIQFFFILDFQMGLIKLIWLNNINLKKLSILKFCDIFFLPKKVFSKLVELYKKNNYNTNYFPLVVAKKLIVII